MVGCILSQSQKECEGLIDAVSLLFRRVGGAVNEGQSLLIKASGCWDDRGRDLYQRLDGGECRFILNECQFVVSWPGRGSCVESFVVVEGVVVS
jgi:hypothetical protein